MGDKIEGLSEEFTQVRVGSEEDLQKIDTKLAEFMKTEKA